MLRAADAQERTAVELRRIQLTLKKRLWQTGWRAWAREQQGPLAIAGLLAVTLLIARLWLYLAAVLACCALFAVPALLRGRKRWHTLRNTLAELGAAQAETVCIGVGPRAIVVGGRWVVCEDQLTALTLDDPTLHAAELRPEAAQDDTQQQDAQLHTATLRVDRTVVGLGKRTHRKREAFVATWPAATPPEQMQHVLRAAEQHLKRWVPSVTAGDQPLQCEHEAEARRILSPGNTPRLLLELWGKFLILPLVVLGAGAWALSDSRTVSPTEILLFVVLPTSLTLLVAVVIGAVRWRDLHRALLPLEQQAPRYAFTCPEHGFVFFNPDSFFTERRCSPQAYTQHGYKALSFSYDATAHRFELREKVYMGSGAWGPELLEMSLDPTLSPAAASAAANEVTLWMDAPKAETGR